MRAGWLLPLAVAVGASRLRGQTFHTAGAASVVTARVRTEQLGGAAQFSGAAFGAGGWAMGDSVELSMSLGCPCFHDGGACWAATRPVASTNATTRVSASAYRNGLSLMEWASGAATMVWVGWRQTVARAPRLVNAGAVDGPA